MIEADFPSTMVEFEEMLGTEEKCRAYLERQKWPNGFVCPRCQSKLHWCFKTRDLWVCAECQHQTSLTAGTYMEGTRKPLRHWYLTMYLVGSSRRGLSAKELQRHLGCSYPTAWTWLHKLRKAMVDPDRKPLSGEVEVDESYIGGTEEGTRGRGADKKTIMICAVEKKEGGKSGRVRLGVIENASKQKINEFMDGTVVVGSSTHTDGWRGYSDLERSGYHHILSIIDGSGFEAHELLPRVHRVFSLVKRWILGTHQGSVSKKHLPIYLEEYTFRFNRRSAKKVTHCFQRLIEGVVRAKGPFYWQIIGRRTAKQPLELAMAA